MFIIVIFRTETNYEDSMILKAFFFQFVNCYACFFYLAFVAGPVGDCGEDGDCMKPLALNLAIIFGTNITIGNVVEGLVPYYNHYRMQNSTTTTPTDHLSAVEQEFCLDKVMLRCA